MAYKIQYQPQQVFPVAQSGSEWTFPTDKTKKL